MQKYLPVLRNCPFFTGLTDDEILSILHCVSATKSPGPGLLYLPCRRFHRGHGTYAVRLHPCDTGGPLGTPQHPVQVQHRRFFGEPYAATPGAILNISVVAEEDCEILLLNVKRLLTACPTACDHHQKLIRNLVSVLANKILLFNDKITHVSKRTTREKLLSYLSAESIRQSSLSFDIPFDRQQLADFLCVERAAMSAELSKLQKEGLLVTKRNHFELLTR